MQQMGFGQLLIGGKGLTETLEVCFQCGADGGLRLVFPLVLLRKQRCSGGPIEEVVQHGGGALGDTGDAVFHRRMHGNGKGIVAPSLGKALSISALQARCELAMEIVAQHLVVVAHEGGDCRSRASSPRSDTGRIHHQPTALSTLQTRAEVTTRLPGDAP